MTTDKKVSVGELKKQWFSPLKLDKTADETGFSAAITGASVRKPGLRMTERPMKLESGHVHVLGETECAYIGKLSVKEREELADEFVRQDIPCFIVSNGINIDAKFKSFMEKRKVVVFKSNIALEALMLKLGELLEWQLAPFTTMHATFVVVHGTGTLLMGKSGMGKSECALELIVRGGKFISDDIVEIKRVGSRLLGSAPETIKHLIEIRGVGILNISDLFGGTSVMESHFIDMVINIEPWKKNMEFERLGFESRTMKILEIDLPAADIPVRPGRNISTLAEVAVRNHILKTNGISPYNSLPESITGPKK